MKRTRSACSASAREEESAQEETGQLSWTSVNNPSTAAYLSVGFNPANKIGKLSLLLTGIFEGSLEEDSSAGLETAPARGAVPEQNLLQRNLACIYVGVG